MNRTVPDSTTLPRRRVAGLVVVAALLALGIGVDHALDARAVPLPVQAPMQAPATAAVRPSPSTDTAVRAALPQPRPAASGASAATDAQRLQARDDWAARAPAHDPFAAATAAPPRTAAVAAVPSAPVAAVPPPFPYSYIGGWADAGVRSAFVARGDRVLWLRKGDLVDGRWRVDSVEPTGARLTYLPLQEPVQLAWGAAP